MSLLQVKDLTVAFPIDGRDCPAVHHISFQLEEGEVLGIVGESGCGKSVTAQTLMGIQHPKAKILSGSVTLEERELLGLTEIQWSEIRGNKISMILQEPMTALNPLIPVGKQMEEVLWIHKKHIKNPKEIVMEMMRDVELRDVEELYHSYPHELSGGMQQRIAIGMALIANPQMVIADEPTTALDATIQAQILRLFQRMKERYEGSFLFISHDLQIVAGICHRVIVMYAGNIVEIGNAHDILHQPAHPYTKGLLRAIPSYKKRGKRLYNIPGRLPSLGDRDFIGCPFAPRCDHRMDICEKVFPEKTKVDHGVVYCHLYGGCHGRNS